MSPSTFIPISLLDCTDVINRPSPCGLRKYSGVFRIDKTSAVLLFKSMGFFNRIPWACDNKFYGGYSLQDETPFFIWIQYDDIISLKKQIKVSIHKSEETGYTNILQETEEPYFEEENDIENGYPEETMKVNKVNKRKEVNAKAAPMKTHHHQNNDDLHHARHQQGFPSKVLHPTHSSFHSSSRPYSMASSKPSPFSHFSSPSQLPSLQRSSSSSPSPFPPPSSRNLLSPSKRSSLITSFLTSPATSFIPNTPHPPPPPSHQEEKQKLDHYHEEFTDQELNEIYDKSEEIMEVNQIKNQLGEIEKMIQGFKIVMEEKSKRLKDGMERV